MNKLQKTAVKFCKLLVVLCCIQSFGLVFKYTVSAVPSQQTERTRLPRFEDYPAGSVFRGKPAPLDTSSNPDLRDYADELRNAMQKGTNFAGHYVIADGLNYAMGRAEAMIIDLRTGKVYRPPQLFGYSSQRGAGYIPPRPNGGLQYRANSNLLLLIGIPGGNDRQNREGRFYYEWKNNQLRLVRYVEDRYRSQ